jgi:hypothetical protein
MTNWDVTVVTDSGFYKKVKLEGYLTQQDAESAALGMTGGKKILSAYPSYSTPKTNDYFGEESDRSEVVEVHHYQEQEEDDDDEYYFNQLDEMEMEMYDLMCKIAMSKDEELPTIKEFHDYLNKNS